MPCPKLPEDEAAPRVLLMRESLAALGSYGDKIGCVLALEFKKTFMDEWSGELDERRLRAAQDGLAAALPGLHDELERLR